MSEQIENTEPVESAPLSTADIAEQIVSQSESESEPTQVAAEPTQTAPTQEELSEAAKFLAEQGHKLKKDDGRDVWLPAKTVEKMLDRFADRRREVWAAEHHAPTAKERDQLKADLAEFAAAIQGDDRQFLELLSSHDPRYKRYLTPAEVKQVQQAEDPEPQPDVDLGNGRSTYSLEGLKKRDEWRERQLLAKVSQQFQPILDRDKQAQEQAEKTQREQAVRSRVQNQIAEAQGWPMFGEIAKDGTLTEFQQQVLTALAQDKTLSLHQAYMKVYIPHAAKLTDRESLVKELNQAPKSTSVPRSTAEPGKTNKRLTALDIAAKVVAEQG